MNKRRWLVLAAYYPPFPVGGGELSDHAIFKAAVENEIEVTVLVSDKRHHNSTVVNGVVVRPVQNLNNELVWWLKKIEPDQLFISGAITLTNPTIIRPYKPTILLRTTATFPVINNYQQMLAACVVPSNWLKKEVEDYYSNLKNKIIVSAPCLPLGLANSKPVGNKRFITLASAQTHKGLDLFLALSKLMPNREFLIADNLHPDLTAKLEPLLAEYRNLTLLTKHRTMSQVYYLSDLLLMPSVPSLHIETFGRVAAEALAWGVVPLTYRIGGPAEWLPSECLVERTETSLEDQLAIWVAAINKLSYCESPVLYRSIVEQGKNKLVELNIEGSANELVAKLCHN